MREISLSDIAREWDANARERCSQLLRGTDISHDRVLLPAIQRVLGSVSSLNVVDFGCGCGFLTRQLGRTAAKVVGIDISRKMINMAETLGGGEGISFRVASLQALSRQEPETYDVCVSNMSFITTPNLGTALRSARRLLKPNGRLVFSIAHPCFWNSYRKDEKGFDYWRTHAVTSRFRISLEKGALPKPTTYFHRSLGTYLSALIGAGFDLERVFEPEPPTDAPRKYLRSYRVPRFMILSGRNNSMMQKRT